MKTQDKNKTKNGDVSKPDGKPLVSGSYDKGVHLDWWNNEKTDRFAMLKKYGYQDEKNPWKYRPLTNKGIFLMYKREQNG